MSESEVNERKTEGYQINIGAIRVVDKGFPAHLSVRGEYKSVWEKFFTGQVYEVQIPANAVTKNGIALWQSTLNTIRQSAYTYAKKTWGKDKRTRVLHQYDEANGRLYFQVKFVPRKKSNEKSDDGE